MEARAVNITNGWLWIKQGYRLFRKSTLLMIVLTAISVLGIMTVAAIPTVGDMLATLLFPALFAGFMLGCRELDRGEELELEHLLAGFQGNGSALIALGGINLVCQILILGVMYSLGATELVEILMAGHHVEDTEVMKQAIENAGPALPIGLVLFSLLLMAMQFAPMLVMFDRLPPLAAMRASLKACLRNVLPLTMYAAMLLPFAFLASVPLMAGWLILLPIMATSVYVAYRDVFSGADAPSEGGTDDPAKPV